MLKTVKVEEGGVPSYTGETPEKAGNAQYSYVFNGWDKALAEVSDDVVYTAQFMQLTNQYAVKFVGDDDTELQNSDVDYGSKVAFNGELPTIVGHTFSHWYVVGDDDQTPWDIANDTITGAITLKAKYTLNSYAVAFTPISGGEAISAQTIDHGGKVTAPTLTTLAGWTSGWYNGNVKWDFDNDVVTEEITLKAKYTQTVTATETFEVYSSITTTKDSETNKLNGYTPTYNTFAITLSNMNQMTVASATIGGAEVDDYSLTGNDLTVNGSAFGATNYGDVEILLSDENGDFAVVVNVPVVTKYVSEVADLQNMPFYGGINFADADQNYAYDGYFVMTKSIECNNAYISRPSDYVFMGDMGNSNGQWYSKLGKCGFAGVFDGQGFAIKNLKAMTYNYGIFGNTQKGSVIKNLAVTGSIDASAGYGRVLLGYNLAGDIQNSYFDVKVGNVTLASGNHLGGSLGWFISGKLTDVVVKFDTTSTPTGVEVGGLAFQLHPHPANWENKASFENVHVFTQAEKLYSYVGDKATGSGVTKYGYDESATVSMTDNKYWGLGGDQPIYKSAGGATKTVAYTGETYQSTAFETYSGISGTTPTANTFSVDLSEYNLPANPTAIKLVTDRASMTVDSSCWVDGVLTIADLGANIYGDVSVVFETADVIYKVSSFKVVTKYLDDYNDLNNISYYGGIDTDTTGGMPYDGYFVMSGDINLNNVYLTDSTKNVSGLNKYDGVNGFAGVFDGNGYKIYNGSFIANTYGIFKNVQSSAVIKNVAIVGTVNKTADTGFVLGLAVAGTLENVYFDLTIAATSTKETVYLLSENMARATMKDVVVKVNVLSSAVKTVALTAYGAQWNGSAHVNLMTLSNVHMFTNATTTQSYTAYYPNAGTPTLNVYALDEGPTTAITMTDSTYWTLVDGNGAAVQPVWKGRTQA